jgi:hypothetical protein
VKKPNETALVKAVLTYLNHVRRIPAFRVNTGAARYGKRLVRYGTPGMADVIGVIPPDGVLLAVECKMPGNQLTELQKAWGDLVTAAGGVYVCVRSVDELIAALATLDS